MLSDEVKTLLFAIGGIAFVVVIFWGAITANNNMMLAKWKEVKATIMVAGVLIDPNDIKSVSEGNVIDIRLKNGKHIKSSEWSIIYDELLKPAK